MQTSLGMVVMTILGLVFSLGALTTIYSQNTFAQNSNTDSINGGISGAGGAYASANSGAGGTSSGTGGYNSNGRFAFGRVLHKVELEEDQAELLLEEVVPVLPDKTELEEDQAEL